MPSPDTSQQEQRRSLSSSFNFAVRSDFANKSLLSFFFAFLIFISYKGTLVPLFSASSIAHVTSSPFATHSFNPVMDNKDSFVKDEELSASSKEDIRVISSKDDGATTTVLLTPAADRALVWKFDLRILPVLAVMYLFNSLDKSNLGNAKTAGLEKTLKLKGHQYNTILSVFFVPYVLTAPFLGILGKKLGPNRVLPAMMFSFGCFTVLVTAVMNFGGLMTIRWFLGMSESAFFPLVIYYLTT